MQGFNLYPRPFSSCSLCKALKVAVGSSSCCVTFVFAALWKNCNNMQHCRGYRYGHLSADSAFLSCLNATFSFMGCDDNGSWALDVTSLRCRGGSNLTNSHYANVLRCFLVARIDPTLIPTRVFFFFYWALKIVVHKGGKWRKLG